MLINKITAKSKDFPILLTEIPSPPKTLFYRGKLHNDSPHVAIIGSRRLTPYGKAVTYKLAYDLASCGIIIVSGLALGIDTIAHKAALDASGVTIAVMAGGLDRVYPHSNQSLADKIIEYNGTLISEYPTGTPPYKQNFVARNRLVSGLALATIVTEAPAHSGALITANFALEQNRLVMSIPGNITSQASEGTNNLIKAGAITVMDAKDVLAALDLEAGHLKAKIIKPASKEEALILDLLAQGINDSEVLIEQSGWTAAQFNQIISLMEISGKVRSLGAGKWVSK